MEEEPTVTSPPEGYPRIIPYLLYEDVDAAVDFLVRTFGFRDRLRSPGADGKSTHAEVQLGDGVVMLGSPWAEGQQPKQGGENAHLVYVYVDDVDDHFATAEAAGATIVRELVDEAYGDRVYAAEDPEGHQWWFAQHVRDPEAESPKG